MTCSRLGCGGAGRGPCWRANLRLLGWETGRVVADVEGIPMNAPSNNTAPKGLRGWWLSPPRPGVQRLISPWEYRHIYAAASVRFAAEIGRASCRERV